MANYQLTTVFLTKYQLTANPTGTLLTACVEPDTVNKDKISPQQNSIDIKRSILVLHEEPNAQEIPPHRYLTFINHAG